MLERRFFTYYADSAKISVYYQNLRSTFSANKLNALKANLELCINKPDNIALTETWLSGNHDMPEIRLDAYHTYRADRKSRSSNKITGGGCLVAVKDSYYSSQIQLTMV